MNMNTTTSNLTSKYFQVAVAKEEVRRRPLRTQTTTTSVATPEKHWPSSSITIITKRRIIILNTDCDKTWSGGHEVALWLNGLRVSDGWFLTNQRVERITWCVIDIELDSHVLERFPDWTSSLIMFMCLFWKMFTFLCGFWTCSTSVAVSAQNSDERVANSYGLKLVRVY